MTRVLAAVGGNITDLTTRLAGDLYVLVADVDIPSTVDIDALTRDLAAVAVSLGVETSLRRIEPDLL